MSSNRKPAKELMPPKMQYNSHINSSADSDNLSFSYSEHDMPYNKRNHIAFFVKNRENLIDALRQEADDQQEVNDMDIDVEEVSSENELISEDEQFTQDYLDLLNMDLEPTSLDYLNRLIARHRILIPFNNVEVIKSNSGYYISTLQPRHALDEMLAGRCGFSHNINSAFKQLLINLGFDVIMPALTLYRYGESTAFGRYVADFGQANSDNALLVNIDSEDYLVDLTWAAGLNHAISPNVEFQILGDKHMRRLRCNQDQFELQVKIKHKWHTEYSFQRSDTQVDQYIPNIRFLCSPIHHLSNTLLLMKCNEDGSNELVHQNINMITGHLEVSYCDVNGVSQTIVINDHDAVNKKLEEFRLDKDQRDYAIELLRIAYRPRLRN